MKTYWWHRGKENDNHSIKGEGLSSVACGHHSLLYHQNFHDQTFHLVYKSCIYLEYGTVVYHWGCSSLSPAEEILYRERERERGNRWKGVAINWMKKLRARIFLDLSEKDREWAESEEWAVRGNNIYVYVCVMSWERADNTGCQVRSGVVMYSWFPQTPIYLCHSCHWLYPPPTGVCYISQCY